ncbi:hypothetical protein CHLRE_11g478966v5 [Chlamydomonas reinhardtii]|uniref:Uncharacterized protein n=1 Tax=Chlamydomonas reinhardtii TaxID=3055 RepID=A0A2K3D8K1_CHLRE|nr:uncharacterized protein CHLRE_11g478966v5 [Chlamydomonas reinhardtii]PNW76852.1 hypothetical protein CHLRE_11g478966v5 [Chlamydomonas reinhardtii]
MTGRSPQGGEELRQRYDMEDAVAERCERQSAELCQDEGQADGATSMMLMQPASTQLVQRAQANGVLQYDTRDTPFRTPAAAAPGEARSRYPLEHERPGAGAQLPSAAASGAPTRQATAAPNPLDVSDASGVAEGQEAQPPPTPWLGASGGGEVACGESGSGTGQISSSGAGTEAAAMVLKSGLTRRSGSKQRSAATTGEDELGPLPFDANREAPTLRLVAGRDEVPRVNTTAALVAQHTPSADNALEAEVAALLEAAGAANAEALEEAEEKLALKALSLEEARERRERLAKLRSLLFYHELKSRRLKAIKSKEYHRHLAKAAKRKATKLAAAAADGAAAGDGDAEAAAARAAAIEAEFQRAKERLTQRHRNTSRWARRALKRGKLEVDPGTKAALAEQIQLGQQLKRKIEGRRGSGSEDEGDSDASTSASDGEGAGAGGRPGGRARSAALELLAGGGAVGADGEEAPKKGLLALPFMKRALERRRLAAAAEAEELLRELDEQAAAGGGGAIGGGGGFGDDGEDDGDGGMTGAGGDALERLVGYGVPAAAANGTAGRRRFGGGAAAAAAATEEADDGNEDLGSDLDSDDAEDAEAKAERLGRKTKEAAAVDAASRKQQQRQAAAAAKKAKRGAAAPPTAAEQADLDAALAAGAAGRGLLVSSEADLLLVDGGADADADQERRRSGGAASTRGGGGGGGDVLAEVAAQRGSVSAGRAGLFQGRKDGAAAAAAAANGSGGDGAAAKFVASKKFVGARPGYAFKKGPQGIGYYLDPKQPLAAALAQPAAAAGGAKGGKGAGAAVAAPVAVAGQAKPAQQQQPHAGKGKQQQQQQQQGGKAGEKQGAAADTGGTASDGNGDDDEAAPLMKAAPSNKDLIRQAFAGDDVAAEFAEEKAAAVAEELPDIQEPSALPGWGAWSSQQRNPKWMQAAKDRAAKQRADAAAGRRDAGMKYVVVSEKWDKKAAKYTAPAAPFPFTSPEAYERSLRQPLGRDFNPDQAFRDLTRPAVIKQAGVTINPLRFSEATAKGLGHKGRAAEAERESKKVVTVAGGMPRVGKGQLAK